MRKAFSHERKDTRRPRSRPGFRSEVSVRTGPLGVPEGSGASHGRGRRGAARLRRPSCFYSGTGPVRSGGLWEACPDLSLGLWWLAALCVTVGSVNVLDELPWDVIGCDVEKAFDGMHRSMALTIHRSTFRPNPISTPYPFPLPLPLVLKG